MGMVGELFGRMVRRLDPVIISFLGSLACDTVGHMVTHHFVSFDLLLLCFSFSLFLMTSKHVVFRTSEELCN